MKNFIRLPFIKFRKSRLHQRLERELVAPGERSLEWITAYNEAVKADNQEEIEKLVGETPVYEEDDVIDKYIKKFTTKADVQSAREARKEHTELIKKLVIQFNASQVDIDGDYLKIKTEDRDIDVYRFAESWAGMADVVPALLTDAKVSECHRLSMLVANAMQRRGVKATIVTGEIYQLSEKSKYLHSWIEFSRDGKDYVVDSVANAIIDKEGYYSYNHVGKTCEVPYRQLKKEIPMLDAMIAYDELLGVLYFADHDKAMEIYNKRVSKEMD